ncbi:HD-GYP domain-containing protein [Niallia sp. Sow4_A1]|uniref:HD-GYP domain-containing protein n=1 Tax=unclassified Niallia TaxID=2837522 RepID=UPI00203F8180|nr:HD-GYP domain-containing protein [Niallia sp. MER TA 168]MCM3361947.1 HD-GYP domain-containing protein [Niallia sp. MER TA 168]
MKLVGTKNIQEGAILAKPILNDRGKVLVNSGVRLEDRIIKRLLDFGVSYVYLEDKHTKDIEVIAAISDQVKMEAMKTIENSFQAIKQTDSSNVSMVMEKNTPIFKKLVGKVLAELKNNEDLYSIMSDVYLYDNYIFSHSLNVTIYTLALGLELKLSPKQMEIIGLGAILHDIGKMSIPLEILMKPGKLTEEEYEIVKSHAEAGFEILRNVQALPLLVAHCAYQHHERLNGTGYPRGLIEEDIHLFGKIIAVADVFDAITSNRVYHDALLPHEALEILYTGSSQLYDAKIVEAFRRAIVLYPNGLSVKLSNGEKGIVCKQNKGMNERPIIRIIEQDGKEIPPYDLDLKEDFSILITECDTIHHPL